MKRNGNDLVRNLSVLVILAAVSMTLVAMETETVTINPIDEATTEPGNETVAEAESAVAIESENRLSTEVELQVSLVRRQCVQGGPCTYDSQCVDYHVGGGTCHGSCINNKCWCD